MIEEVGSVNQLAQFLWEYGIIEYVSPDGDWRYLNQTYEGVFFRGQSAKYNSIICGLPRRPGFIKNEYLMYSETLEEKKQEFSEFETPIEYLSKMQHYGLPTRLIDFSVNPLIALFFAVQDVTSPDDGILYIYKKEGKELNDPDVQLLSTLASVKSKEPEFIIEAMQSAYAHEFDKDEVLSRVPQVVFIRYTEYLKRSNPRLHNQQGTFAICGNKVSGKTVTNQVMSVSPEEATLRIRIPYEFKAVIKEELNHVNINESVIYPEFTQWADYIRNRYGADDFSPESAYSVVSVLDNSLPDLHRYQVFLVLNQAMDAFQAKRVVIDLIKSYRKKKCIVQFFVAKDGSDYVNNIWLLEGEWLSNNVEFRYASVPLRFFDKSRYYWKMGISIAARREYESRRSEVGDKTLFLAHFYNYRISCEAFESLYQGYDILDYEVFCDEVIKRKHVIDEISFRLSHLANTTDMRLDNYFWNFVDFNLALSNIALWTTALREVPEDWVHYRISSSFKTAHSAMDRISRDKREWMNRLKITTKELNNFSMSLNDSEFLGFRQFLPVSDEAIPVYFKPQYYMDSSCMIITVDTNLFDDARATLYLLLRHGKALAHEDLTIENGKVSMIVDLALLEYRNYTFTIGISTPRTQRISFVDKAGEEYEYLTGPWVQRGGIDSTIYFESCFTKEDILTVPDVMVLK